MGSQLVRQEVNANTITRNMTRDSRELQTSLTAGQSQIEALSNAGTWMYKENTNLGGLYSSLGNYNAHSILESQLGISGTVQTTTFGALYGLTNAGGKGLANWNASSGDVNTMLSTGAMLSPALTLDRSYGMVKLTYDKDGNLVGSEFNTGLKSDILQTNLQNSLSQSKNNLISTVWSATWGNSQTYQKAIQSTSAITEQFLKDYTSGIGIDDRASIDSRTEVREALAEAKELRDRLMEEYGLSKEEATQFVAEFTTKLNLATSKTGGKLDMSSLKDIFKNTLSKFGSGISGGAKGIENFEQ